MEEMLSCISFDFGYFVGLSDVSCIQCTLNLPWGGVRGVFLTVRIV